MVLADDSTEFGEIVGDEDAQMPSALLSGKNLRDEVSDLLVVLDDRERKIIFQRFALDGGKPKTLEEVGKKFGVGHPEIFAIGDMACFKHQTGQPLPGVSPAAMQMGRHATKNILFLIRGDKSKPFRYFDIDSMATIGRNKAIADLKFARFGGFLAWLSWLFDLTFFNWAAQSTAGALPVDLGLLYIWAERAAHLRNIAARKKTQL